VIESIHKQNKGSKATGLDGIPMEAIIYGGHRLFVHLCLLFNMFMKAGYLPRTFTQAVIVRLVKCKTGNLVDINNYRAIAISTALSKLFQSVIAKQVFTYADCEKHISLDLRLIILLGYVLKCLSKQLIIMLIEEAMHVLLTIPRPLTV